MTGHTPLGVGIVGAGGFGAFVADAATELGDDVVVVAVADSDPDRARLLADRHRAHTAPDLDGLLADDAVEAVVIATPPCSHAGLTVAALAAGRHVFCEKPTALDLGSAEAVEAAVARSGRAYVVDHVLRFNPVLAALARLREAGLLGEVQRFTFDNDAADEDLPADHWFWNETISGGIFLEHGVHFFDAAEMLIGRPAARVQALGTTRADGITDTVACTVAHAGGALAGHAHGFSHAHRAERQLMRIDYGLAEARVHGWIPLRAELDVWTARADEFAALPARADDLLSVPGYRRSGLERIDAEISAAAAPSGVRARGVAGIAPHHVRLTIDLGRPHAKQRVYLESVRAALHDFAVCARTGAAPRAGITQGRAAVAVAAAATAALRDGRTHCVDTPADIRTEEVPCHTPA